MTKTEILELGKKYDCDISFGAVYYNVLDKQIAPTKYTKQPPEEFIVNNSGKCIYITTFKDDNVLWGDKKIVNDRIEIPINEHYSPPYIWLRAVAYDKPSKANILKKLLNDPITLNRKPTPLKRLSKLQKEHIDNWLQDESNSDLIILNKRHPDSVTYKSFSKLSKDEYDATEFWCAMQYLDKFVPRVDERGEEYSIVGRIKLLYEEQ